MNNTINLTKLSIIAALATCAACGSGLNLTKPEGGTGASTASSAVDAGTAGSPNTTLATSANDTTASANSNVATSRLKCRQGMVNGGEIVSCSCATDNNQTCPIYNNDNDSNQTVNPNVYGNPNEPNTYTDPNGLGAVTAGSHTFTCTTQPVTGGYVYSCNCGDTRNIGDNSPGCPAFFNPADASAVAPTAQPSSTCQSHYDADAGTETTCTCLDSEATGPCPFYQGNSYVDSANPYQETCTSVLTSAGVTTACTCAQQQQPAGVTCPQTFDPLDNVYVVE